MVFEMPYIKVHFVQSGRLHTRLLELEIVQRAASSYAIS